MTSQGQSPSRLTPHQLVAGRYEIVRPLGMGTSGSVYQCRDVLLGGRTVALKLYSQRLFFDKTSQARVHRELRSIFRVKHDNVIAFYDVVQYRDLLGYTMEYAGGGTLESVLSGTEEPDGEWILSCLLQLCQGLRAVHRADLVHRDLKPANILLSDDKATVKISDFGLARRPGSKKMVASDDHGMGGVTLHGQVMGTPRYLSPEYVQDGTSDFRSDVYALGLIGYELIARSPAFDGETTLQVLMQKLEYEPPPLHVVAPDCPERLSEIIHRAMHKNPEERYQSVEGFRDALWRFLDARPSPAAPAAGPRRRPAARRAAGGRGLPGLAASGVYACAVFSAFYLVVQLVVSFVLR